MNVVEQQLQKDIQRLVQRAVSPQRAQGLLVITDQHQLVPAQQHAKGRNVEREAVLARIVLGTFPDDEQRIRVKLDARNFVRVECRGNGMLIKVKSLQQQSAFPGIRFAEPQHLSLLRITCQQLVVVEFQALNHRFTMPDRGV